MGWFTRTAKATGSAPSPGCLHLHRTIAPSVDVAVGRAPWIAFIQIGEAFGYVYEGWWLLGTPDGAVAVNSECPMVDRLLRDADLAVAAEAVLPKFVLYLLSRPMCLRGRSTADGVALLDASQTEYLRSKGTIEVVQRLDDIPRTD